MSVRQLAKSLFTPDQQRQIRRAIDTLYRRPLGRLRRIGQEGRVPYRPGGRKWASKIPLDLHFTIQDGTIEYVYRDVPMLKHPMEMALYTLLVWNLKPRTIIEIGSKAGGSALWLSDQMRSFGIDGKIVSIDITPPSPPFQRDEITFIKGDSNALGECLTPEMLRDLPRPFLVIEDASHFYKPTLTSLMFCDSFLRPGEYLVVEDGNVSDMGDDAVREGGPGRAISEFLRDTAGRYEIDQRYCDRYGHNVTGNPNGYLRRVRD